MKLLTLLPCLASCFFTINASRTDPECGDWEGAFYRYGYCYRLYTDRANGSQAKEYCETKRPNGKQAVSVAGSGDLRDELQFIIWTDNSIGQGAYVWLQYSDKNNCKALTYSDVRTTSCRPSRFYLCQESVQSPCWHYRKDSKFFEGFCFAFHREQKPRYQAKDICGSDNAALAEPDNSGMINFLLKEAAIQEDVYGLSSYYLGASDMGQDGTFVWETSERPVTPEGSLSWAPSEPNGGNAENHLELIYTGGTFQLNDIDGNANNRSFICQKENLYKENPHSANLAALTEFHDKAVLRGANSTIQMYSHVFIIRNSSISNELHVTAITRHRVLITGSFLDRSGNLISVKELESSVEHGHPFITDINDYLQDYKEDISMRRLVMVVLRSSDHVTVVVYSQMADGQFRSHLVLPTDILSNSYIINAIDNYRRDFKMHYIALDQGQTSVWITPKLSGTSADRDNSSTGPLGDGMTFVPNSTNQYQRSVISNLPSHTGILVHADRDILVFVTGHNARLSRQPILLPQLPLDILTKRYYTVITEDTPAVHRYTVVAIHNDTRINAHCSPELEHFMVLLQGDATHTTVSSHVPCLFEGTKPFYLFKSDGPWNCNSQIIPPSLWRSEYCFTVPESLTAISKVSTITVAPMALEMKLNGTLLPKVDCKTIIHDMMTCTYNLSMGHYRLESDTPDAKFLAYLQGTGSTGRTFCHPLGVNHTSADDDFVYDYDGFGEDIPPTPIDLDISTEQISTQIPETTTVPHHEPSTSINVDNSTEQTSTEIPETTAAPYYEPSTATNVNVSTKQTSAVPETPTMVAEIGTFRLTSVVPTCLSTSLCRCAIPDSNATLKDPTASLQEIQKLRLSIHETSSHRRTKISVYDGRPSAVSVGMAGVGLIVFALLIIVLSDVITFVNYLIGSLKNILSKI